MQLEQSNWSSFEGDLDSLASHGAHRSTMMAPRSQIFCLHDLFKHHLERRRRLGVREEVALGDPVLILEDQNSVSVHQEWLQGVTDKAHHLPVFYVCHLGLRVEELDIVGKVSG